MSTLRVIGDVHGCIDVPHPRKGISYRDIIAECDWSVQLGDMGFNYSGLQGVGHRHIFIPGNHDNYDALPEQSIGDYGPVIMGPFSFFFVRGEWSIDVKSRKARMSIGGQKEWWKEEELSAGQMADCLELYKQVKPEVVMSHGCPISMSELVGNPGVWAYFGWDKKRVTNTQYLLEYMLQEHQPKLWLFGHYHRNWTMKVGRTTFQCIDELDCVDFDERWNVV